MDIYIPHAYYAPFTQEKEGTPEEKTGLYCQG
jgi:hypothetical protein